MLSILTTAWSFLRSKTGMILAIVGLVLLAMWRIFAAGKESAKSEQRERRLEDIGKARKVEDGVRRKPADQRRKDLGKWSR